MARKGKTPMDIVLVGDGDSPATVPPDLARYVGFQWRCTMEQPGPPAGNAASWKLLSIDYQKVIRWDGDGRPTARARKLMRAVVDARDRLPGCRIRVHNVPARTSIYRFLLDAGVDLIGVVDLAKGESVLQSLGR